MGGEARRAAAAGGHPWVWPLVWRGLLSIQLREGATPGTPPVCVFLSVSVAAAGAHCNRACPPTRRQWVLKGVHAFFLAKVK